MITGNNNKDNFPKDELEEYAEQQKRIKVLRAVFKADMESSENEDSNTKKLLINSVFGVASTIIATLLIGVYVQIGSTSQEIIRLQEQVRNIQVNSSDARTLVSDVRTVQARFEIMEDRLERIEGIKK